MYEIYISNLILTTDITKFPNLDSVVLVGHTDKVLVHSDVVPNKECKIVDGNLKIADNASGSLEITVPPYNLGYDQMQPLITEVTVVKDGFDYWYGRLLTVDDDFWKQKKCVFEGELSYLLDSRQTPNTYSLDGADNNSAYINYITNGNEETIVNPTPETYGLTDEDGINISAFLRRWLEDILSKHNAVVEPYKRFMLGDTPNYVDMDAILNGKDKIEIETNFETTLDTIKSNFLDLGMDVHAVIRHVYKSGTNEYDRVIDFVTGFTPNTGGVQAINFGENLLDYATNLDGSVFYTVIYPRGNTIEHQVIDFYSEYIASTDAKFLETKRYYERVEDTESDTYVYRSVSIVDGDVDDDGKPLYPYNGYYEKKDYFLSSDVEVIPTKTYYERGMTDYLYDFKEVELTSNRDNPNENKWFERDFDDASEWGRPRVPDPTRASGAIPSYTYNYTLDEEVIYGKEYFELKNTSNHGFIGFDEVINKRGIDVSYFKNEYIGCYITLWWNYEKIRIDEHFTNYIDEQHKAMLIGNAGYKPIIYAYQGDFIEVVADLMGFWGSIDNCLGEKTANELTENTDENFGGTKSASELLGNSLLTSENENHFFEASEDYETNDLYVEGEGVDLDKGEYIKVVNTEQGYRYKVIENYNDDYYFDNPLWDDGNLKTFSIAKEKFKTNRLYDNPLGTTVQKGDHVIVVWVKIGPGKKDYSYRFRAIGQHFAYRLITDIYEKAEINLDLFKQVIPKYTENPNEKGWYYLKNSFDPNNPSHANIPVQNRYKLATETTVKYGRHYFHLTILPPASTFKAIESSKIKPEDNPRKKGWFELITDTNKSECVTLIGQKTGQYNGGDLYLDGQIGALYNMNGVKKFGYIYNVSDFNADTSDSLLEKAIKFFNKFKYEYMTIEVTALDLHYLNPDIHSFELLQQIICRSEPHNLNTDPNNVLYFPVTEIDIDLTTPENTKYTLNSNTNKSLSTSVSDSNKNFNKYVEETRVPSASEILENAKSHADDVIKKSIYGSYAGFIYDNTNDELNSEVQLKPVDPNNPGLGNRSCGIRVADGPTDKEATHKWVWYAGGLAHYNKTTNGAYNGPVVDKKAASKGSGKWSKSPNVAITMDGKIVADFITTGNLKLGGSGSNAYLEVYSDSAFIGAWKSTGIEIYKGKINLGNNFVVDTNGLVTIKKGSINLGAAYDKNGNLYYKFTVNDQGYMNAVSGKFSGDISAATGYFQHKLEAGAYNSTLGAYPFNVDTSGNLRIGPAKDSKGNLYYNFSVTPKGEITAYSGVFKGDISGATGYFQHKLEAGTPDQTLGYPFVVATDGTLKIGPHQLTHTDTKGNKTKVKHYYFSVNEEGTMRIGPYRKKNSKGEESTHYYFSVNKDGTLKAKKGEIGVWTITEEELTDKTSAILAPYKIGCGKAGEGIAILRGGCSLSSEKSKIDWEGADGNDKNKGFIQLSNSGSTEKCKGGIRIYGTGHIVMYEDDGSVKWDRYLKNIPLSE